MIVISLYTNFDYLCNEPFFIDGVGTVKCPTLRDIRTITFKVFALFQNIIDITLESYLKSFKTTFDEPDEKTSESISLFRILLYDNSSILFSMIKFFILDEIEFNQDTNCIDVFNYYQVKNESDVFNQKRIIGHIGEDNFDTFRDELRCLLGMNSFEEEKPKFAKGTEKLAQTMFNRFRENALKSKKNKNKDRNYTLDNMICKYCTHNKVGINILNVWDMTYYQFISMFNEYLNGRKHDFNDMMAANTFSYKKSSDYNPMGYIKKLNM